ncbi:MAG: ribosome assembly factor SBDS [Candidatus Woesearchaeota archaeon]
MPDQMYSRDEKISLNLARIKKGGKDFEVVVDADLAVQLRAGKAIDVKDVLKSENIFSDAKKGLFAPEHELKQIFETDEALKIAEIIIREGEIQLTADFRKRLREQKRLQIVNLIHSNAVDPTTHLPHPAERIERAMEEAKVRIDEFKNAEEQLQDVIKALRVLLPIKFEIDEIALKIPAEHAVRAFSTVKSNAKILRDEWQRDGSWVCVVELPAGLREDFFAKVNKITKGNVDTKILKTR